MSDLKKITISMAVLSALSPQSRLLNSKEEDILGKTFKLHSLMAPAASTTGEVNLDTVNAEENQSVRTRWVDIATNKAFVVPIRSLLNIQIAKTDAENVKYVAPTENKPGTPTYRVHEHLLETGKDAADVELPETFTVVAVNVAKTQGTDIVMYPTYMYQKFVDRVAEVRKTNATASLDEVYRDYDFMMSLYGTPLASRFLNAEPNKEIVITV